MNQEYLNLNKTSYGGASIGIQVFEGIAIAELERIEEISFGNQKAMTLPLKSAVQVQINKDNQVSIILDINVNYGKNITKVTNLVQSKISNAVKEMTGVTFCKVNVTIAAINF